MSAEYFVKEAVEATKRECRIETLADLINHKMLSLSDAAEYIGMSEDGFMEAVERLNKKYNKATTTIPMSEETYEKLKAVHAEYGEGMSQDEFVDWLLQMSLERHNIK